MSVVIEAGAAEDIRPPQSGWPGSSTDATQVPSARASRIHDPLTLVRATPQAPWARPRRGRGRGRSRAEQAARADAQGDLGASFVARRVCCRSGSTAAGPGAPPYRPARSAWARSSARTAGRQWRHVEGQGELHRAAGS